MPMPGGKAVQHRVSSSGGTSSPSAVGVALAAIAGACGLAVILVNALGNGSTPPQGTRLVVAGESAPLMEASGAGLGTAASARSLGQRLGSGLVLEPATAGAPPGHVVSDRSDSALLSEARLRAGDLIVDFDGLPLEPAAIGAFNIEVAHADSLELTIIRQGQLRRRTIRLKG